MTDAADDEQLATALQRLCAGRHVIPAELRTEPAIRALDPDLCLDPASAPMGANTRLSRLLGDLAERGDAVQSNAPERVFTVRRDGEDYAALWDRHAAHLIAAYPATYAAEGFMRHLTEPLLFGRSVTSAERLRSRRPGVLAEEDARLAVTWYPDGMQDLRGDLTDADREHFQGYAIGLRRRALEYAAAIAQGPRRLRQELDASRIPCRAGSGAQETTPHPRWLSASTTDRTYLWVQFHGDRALIHLLGNRRDRVTDRAGRVIGVAEIPLRDLPLAHLYEMETSPERCCSEVYKWGLVLYSGRQDGPAPVIRFHTYAHPLPAIPSVRPRRYHEDQKGDVAAQPLGLLATNVGDPWTGIMLWGDGVAPRIWERMDQGHVVAAVREGRLWSEAGGLSTRRGGRTQEAAPLVIKNALTLALPYTVSQTLHQL